MQLIITAACGEGTTTSLNKINCTAAYLKNVKCNLTTSGNKKMFCVKFFKKLVFEKLTNTLMTQIIRAT